MEYYKIITIKNGKTCILRNGNEDDAEKVLSNFVLTHSQTDYLTTYPDELKFTVEKEKEFLKRKTESEREVEIIAIVDGMVVGTAGIDSLGSYEKIRHRASFGISIDVSYCGLGIGYALTCGCIECAKKAGYKQIELEVVIDNERAISLYKKLGFVEYGRNPKAFISRINGETESILMRLEIS